MQIEYALFYPTVCMSDEEWWVKNDGKYIKISRSISIYQYLESSFDVWNEFQFYMNGRPIFTLKRESTKQKMEIKLFVYAVRSLVIIKWYFNVNET